MGTASSELGERPSATDRDGDLAAWEGTRVGRTGGGGNRYAKLPALAAPPAVRRAARRECARVRPAGGQGGDGDRRTAALPLRRGGDRCGTRAHGCYHGRRGYGGNRRCARRPCHRAPN